MNITIPVHIYNFFEIQVFSPALQSQTRRCFLTELSVSVVWLVIHRF